MRKLLFLILLVIILSCSCSAYVVRSGNVINPTKEIVKRSEIYNKGFDDVWNAVVKACAEADVSIKVIEKVSGIITAERSIPATEELRETFETGQISVIYDKKQPAGFMGCANPAYVATRGKVVESKVIELDLLSEFEKQCVSIIFSYNVYVERMDNNETKVNVNIFAYPSRREITYSTAQDDVMTGVQVAQVIEVDISQAKFLSKGKFEDLFLALIKKLIEKRETHASPSGASTSP